MRMSWGNWLFVAILAFMIMILYMVYRSTQEHVSLVTENYYAQELVFTEKQQKRHNAKALGDSFQIEWNKGVMVLKFPSDQVDLTGQVNFYRPSDENLDTTRQISVDSANVMVVPLDGLVPGLWHVNVDWIAGNEAFYIEDSFIK